MRAILLAAGLGTRLRPLTETVPKCLVPINGKPLLEIWLDLLLGSGVVERVLVNTSWLSEQVDQFIKQSPWSSRVELFHESKLLGTAGTLRENLGWIGADDVFVAHADNLTSFDVEDFTKFHRNRPINVNLTMMTFETDVPEACGIVELDDKDRVLAFHEKVRNPPGKLANGAVYIFDQEVLKFISRMRATECDLSLDVIPEFLGKIVSYQNKRYHRDIGTVRSLKKACEEFSF